MKSDLFLKFCRIMQWLFLSAAVLFAVFTFYDTFKPEPKQEINILTPEPSPKPFPKVIDVQLSERVDNRLESSAWDRAYCIAEGDCKWSHDGWKETIAKHVIYKKAGEILAKDFDNWSDALAAWKKSPTHKAVLDAEWCIFGTAKYKRIYVIHFACE